MDRVFVNGQLQSTISATDRGVLYGDSLFETVALAANNPLMLDAHLLRLKQGINALKFNVDFDILQKEIAEFLQYVKQEGLSEQTSSADLNSILRVTITRGEQSRGYRPVNDVAATRILSLHDWPSLPTLNYSQGVSVAVSYVAYSYQKQLAGIKHGNRLEQVLASQSMPDEVDDVLMHDQQYCLISVSKGNVFIQMNDQWLTPNLSLCGIKGVVRAEVIKYFIAEEIDYAEKKIPMLQLEQNIESIQAAFICNSIIGIVPIRSMMGMQLNSANTCESIRDYLTKSSVISQV